MMFQGSAKRMVAAFLMALAATFILADIVVPSPPAICEGIDNPILRWLLGCDEGEGAGGGGGGAK